MSVDHEAGRKLIAAEDALFYSVFTREELFLDRWRQGGGGHLFDDDIYYRYTDGQIKITCVFGPGHDLCHLAELGPKEVQRMFLPNFGWKLTGKSKSRAALAREIRVRAYQWHLRIHLGEEMPKREQCYSYPTPAIICYTSNLLGGAWHFGAGTYNTWGKDSFPNDEALAQWMLGYFFAKFKEYSFEKLVEAWKIKANHLRQRKTS